MESLLKQEGVTVVTKGYRMLRTLGLLILAASVIALTGCSNPNGVSLSRPSPHTPTQALHTPAQASTVKLQATTGNDAPFSIEGSTVQASSAQSKSELTMTIRSPRNLVLDDERWTFVNDENDPKIAVGGYDCNLKLEPDELLVLCAEAERLIRIREGEPLRESLDIWLLDRTPTGEYSYTKSLDWWYLEQPVDAREAWDAKRRPPDGTASVRIQINVVLQTGNNHTLQDSESDGDLMFYEQAITDFTSRRSSTSPTEWPWLLPAGGHAGCTQHGGVAEPEGPVPSSDPGRVES